MHTSCPAACSACNRRGLLSMELVLTLPVLTLLLLGLFEFSCLYRAHLAATRASRAAAAVVARPDATAEDVDEAVRRTLDPSLTEAVQVRCLPSQVSGDRTVCRVRLPMAACTPNLLWPVGFDLEGRFVEGSAQVALR
jgi:Flp pilus assembly protein TadG